MRSDIERIEKAEHSVAAILVSESVSAAVGASLKAKGDAEVREESKAAKLASTSHIVLASFKRHARNRYDSRGL